MITGDSHLYAYSTVRDGIRLNLKYVFQKYSLYKFSTAIVTQLQTTSIGSTWSPELDSAAGGCDMNGILVSALTALSTSPPPPVSATVPEGSIAPAGFASGSCKAFGTGVRKRDDLPLNCALNLVCWTIVVKSVALEKRPAQSTRSGLDNLHLHYHFARPNMT